MGVLGGGWTMESGGGQGRGGWIKESVNLVSVGGWVCVCVGVLSVGLGPGLDSMSPARSRRSASHAAGTHGWLPKKTGRPGLRRGGVGGYNLNPHLHPHHHIILLKRYPCRMHNAPLLLELEK